MNAEPDQFPTGADAWSRLKRHGKTFAWAAHLTPRRDANRLARLYAMCRLLDDMADLNSDTRVDTRLLALRSQPWVSTSSDPLARELADMVAEIGLNPVTMRQLLDGLISDLDHQVIADEEGLIRYSYHVAGTVGLMVCDVLAVNAPTARNAAVNLGIAMQLTNIARDVNEDALSGRRYVPSTWLDASPADIADPSPELQRSGASAVLRLLDLADGYYARANCGFAFLPLSSRPGLVAAAHVYRGIGGELRRRNGAFHRGRVFVPPWRKAVLTANALVALAFKTTSPVAPDLPAAILDLTPPPHQVHAAPDGRW